MRSTGEDQQLVAQSRAFDEQVSARFKPATNKRKHKEDIGLVQDVLPLAVQPDLVFRVPQ